jgi:hypothetical protein
MADRRFDQGVWTLQKEVCLLEGNFVVGSSGAVATVKGSGISSVVKNGTDGNYTITLEDSYNRYLAGTWGIIKNTSFSGVSNIEIQQDPATFQATFQANKTITIQCYDNSGAAVNPAAASVIGFLVFARRSSIPGKGE